MADKHTSQIVNNGVKLAGDFLLVPGSSLFLDGKFKNGFLHATAGLLAKAALGIPGLLLVGANSYCMSRTGKSLLSSILDPKDPKDVLLRNKVEAEMAAGKNLDEILAGVAEDVEDLYEENREERGESNGSAT